MSLKNFFDPDIRLGTFQEWKEGLRLSWEQTTAALPVHEEPPKPVPASVEQTSEENKPHWKHTCDTCKYMASVRVFGNLYDMYHCGAALLIRWGNNGNIESWATNSLPVMLERDIPHAEVFRLALAVYSQLKKP